ncbi:MAG: hypothetical protein H6737_01700 [Alphaproteobacteria bacterium]|nr:hypothetical protein [Alphaproteobacteria bacterium]
MERTVQQLLEGAGDLAGAFLWRRVCRDLEAGLKIGVVARDPEVGRRLVAALPEREGVEWVPIHLDLRDDVEVSLGSQDRLLAVHALLFGTPMTAALGTTERRGLEALVEAGAPGLRAVTVVDADLLTEMSDDPTAERAMVLARLEELLPDDWPLVDDTRVAAWLADLAARDTAALRRAEVGPYLLAESAERIAETLAAAKARLDEVDALLAKEDAALADARRRGQRIAAHTLAVIRRQTEQLDLDLQEFLRTLEADLPAQIRDLDVGTARRTLPHWLAHIVESWMSDRLARWRRDVLEELADIDIEEVVRAELLVPALQPAPVRGEAQWGRRLGTTAAFGGAAALLALGLWIPGLVALASGVIWTTFQRGDTDEATRQKLVATARAALRQMGTDAQRLLHDQINQISEDLEQLADEGEESERTARARLRGDLEDRRRAQAGQVDELTRAHTLLTEGLPA